MKVLKPLALLRWSIPGFMMAVAFGLATLSIAKSGDLDASFGAGTGKVLLPIGAAVDHVLASALQADGKIVVSGYCYPAISSYVRLLCVVRLLNNGSLDPSFAAAGVFLGDFSQCRHGGSLAILPDQSIVVGGTVFSTSTGDQVCAMKLTPQGSIDPLFGASGVSAINFPAIRTLSTFSRVLAVNDGKLLFATSCYVNYSSSPVSNFRYGFCALRLNSDGSLDTSYGSAGLVISYDSSVNAYFSDVVVDEGGALIVGSCVSSLNRESMCAMRFDTTGAVAASFGAAGRATFNLGAYAKTAASSVARLADQQYLLVGLCGATMLYKGCVVRLTKDGAFDPGFGGSGAVVDSSNNAMSNFSAIRVIDTGTYALAGRCGVSVDRNAPCIWKVSETGSFVQNFGNLGNVQVEFATTIRATSSSGVLLQSNGKLVLATSCVYADLNEDFCLARLLNEEGYFDLDGNNQTNPAHDGTLFVRYLFGLREASLTTGALGVYADRASGTDIATYLSTPNATYPHCSTNIVGAPGGPSAMLDGIVLMRAMFGLTGTAVTTGINFPVGTTRTTWSDIKAHLNTNCGMALN